MSDEIKAYKMHAILDHPVHTYDTAPTMYVYAAVGSFASGGAGGGCVRVLKTLRLSQRLRIQEIGDRFTAVFVSFALSQVVRRPA